MLNCKNCWKYSFWNHSRKNNIQDACPFYQGRMENKPLKEIEKEARKDDAAAIYLAACLLHGHRMPKNERKAKALLENIHIKKGYHYGYVATPYVLSLCYFLNPVKSIIKPEQAINLCVQSAARDCNLAAMELYRYYAAKEDRKQAGKWCKHAAQHYHTDAYAIYAEMCCSNLWGVYDMKEACKYFELLLQQGDTSLRDRLKDLCYEYAEQVNAQDFSEACNYFEKALQYGHSAAQDRLKRLCYEYAERISPKNVKDACDYYEKAQAYGHPAAYDRLVELHQKDLMGCYRNRYYQSEDNEKYWIDRGEYCLENKYAPNEKMSLDYYRSARKILLKKRKEARTSKKDALSIFNQYNLSESECNQALAKCQEQIKKCCAIILTEQSSPSRKALYEKAVGGDAEAQYELARLFQDEKFDLYDLFESAHWHRLAAEQGHASAQHRLGYCYIEGCGVEKNETEAFHWTRKAAEQGNVNAEFNLGWCYYNGFGVTKSHRDAFCWYKAAGEQGNTKAQYQIGCFYETGTGVERNLFEAAKWLAKSADSDYVYAQAKIGAYYAKGIGVEQSYQKAVKYYGFAANKGIAIAQYNLGKCYFDGEGVDQSYEKAVAWYTHSAKQDCAVAQNNLAVCYFYGYGVRKDVYKALEWFEKAAKNGNKKAEANRLICEQQIEDNRARITYVTETTYPSSTYGVDPPQDSSGELTDDEAWWAIASGMMSVDSTGM